MIKAQRRILVLSLATACCAGAPSKQAAGAPARVSLQVQALTGRSESWRAIAPGETLHSGDRLTLRVEVDQPAYIYVAQAQPTRREGGESGGGLAGET